MDIKQTQSRMLKVADLRPNEGQIPDVPANPRYISEREYDELKASIEADNLTGVLQMKVYQYEGAWVVLDGNMRLKALQDLGIDEVQCLLVPDDADAKTLRKIVVSANSTFGQWDMDMLANEWDADEVRLWGINILDFGENNIEGLFNEEKEHEKTKDVISVQITQALFPMMDEIKDTIRNALLAYEGAKVL